MMQSGQNEAAGLERDRWFDVKLSAWLGDSGFARCYELAAKNSV